MLYKPIKLKITRLFLIKFIKEKVEDNRINRILLTSLYEHCLDITQMKLEKVLEKVMLKYLNIYIAKDFLI